MKENITVTYVKLTELKSAAHNPRTWTKEQLTQLKESLKNHGFVDPVLANNATGRENILIGGHMRIEAAKELGIKEIPVVYLSIPDLAKEKELCIRLNKNHGDFDMDLLAQFDESFLTDIGFSSSELDTIFEDEKEEGQFDLEKELEKLNIETITVKKGDIYELDGSRLMCGDSTIEEDILRLAGEDKVDMVMTDPPYILDYSRGKTRHGNPTIEVGTKKNRRYLETESIPTDFTEKWMANIVKVQAPNFSIICYEAWKNVRTIWNEMEKHWKVRNMLVWHLSRNQGYAGKHKFFSKYDIAMVGTSESHAGTSSEVEEDLFENEYQTALYAISGNPEWEEYKKGKKLFPTDFIEYRGGDEKSGQGIIFGTKPTEILIPYIKVLTKRDQIVLEPFGGSGSTLIASTKLKRRCLIMEKSPVYAEVILARWEKYTGKKRVKIA